MSILGRTIEILKNSLHRIPSIEMKIGINKYTDAIMVVLASDKILDSEEFGKIANEIYDEFETSDPHQTFVFTSDLETIDSNEIHTI